MHRNRLREPLPAGRAAASAAVLLLCAACGTSPPDPSAPDSSAPDLSAPTGGGGASGSQGITADEARSAGAYSAEYDAHLDPPAPSTTDVLVLTNIGQLPDRYRIDVAGGGTVEPSTMRLDPGRSARLHLNGVAEGAEIRVVSEGSGRELARRTVG